MNTEKLNLLNLKDGEYGYLLRMNIDVESLLLAGIVEIEISRDFGEVLRSEFFSYDTTEFVPDKKDIKRAYKVRKKSGDNKTLMQVAQELAKDFR